MADAVVSIMSHGKAVWALVGADVSLSSPKGKKEMPVLPGMLQE